MSSSILGQGGLGWVFVDWVSCIWAWNRISLLATSAGNLHGTQLLRACTSLTGSAGCPLPDQISCGLPSCEEAREAMATHSCILAWRIPMVRGAWWAAVHGAAKSRDTVEAT